jgi:hypothetical protein
MYRKTSWKDHVVQRPKTYTETVNPDGTKTFADAPGEIVQQGTPMSATNFNNLEDGLGDVAASLDLLIAYVMMKLSRSNYTLDGLDAAKLDANANAASATKLNTARAIGITGKATGAGVNFDGTGAININITAIDPTGLSAPVPLNKGGTNGTDAPTARTNIGAVAQTTYDQYVTDRAKELLALVVAVDIETSIRQAEARAQENRLATLEAQLAAMM